MTTYLTVFRSRLLLVVAIVTLLFLPLFFIVRSAHAGNVYVVTRFDDPAPGNCDLNDCSLREAIKAANLSLGGSIELPSGTYTLTLLGAGEDGNATGDLDINSSITLNGDPNDPPTILGGPGWDDRILHIFTGLTVNLNDVSISGGNSDFWGGGIYNYGGLLSLSNCGIYNNYAVAGGGIMNDNSGTLAMTNCHVDANEASNNGGGVYVGGNSLVTIIGSEFSNNLNSAIVNWGDIVVSDTFFHNNVAGWGGAVSNSGTATINNSTFDLNEATITGGAVSNNGDTLVFNIYNSEFTNNTAVFSGGALTNLGFMILSGGVISGSFTPGDGGGILNSGHMTVNSVTIDDNEGAGTYAIGGGINNSGAITITNSSITNNTATVGWGGGIVNTENGQVSLVNSTVSGNQALKGGGIYNYGAMSVDEGIVSQNISFNSTDSGGGVFNANQLVIANTAVLTNSANGQGGGIYNGATAFYTSTGTLTMTQSLVAANTAANSHGGGIAVLTGTINLENSTISNNSTTRHGGGIYNSTGAVSLNYVTIAENTADSSQLNLGNGGGFYTENGTFTLTNTLIAINTDGSNESPDCWGTPATQGYNLVQSITGCTFVATTGDITGQNAQLQTLADNGGLTFTHALQTGSPAIDNANPNDCLAVDQRGAIRPTDGDDNGDAFCDIGAYETGSVTWYIYLPIVTH